jgi:hypothetical protein
MSKAILQTLTIQRSPRLETILMTEEFIREHSGEFRRRSLWEHLPKKMMYQTFSTIMNYLEYSGKIAFDKERKVGWIYNPALVKKYLKREDLSWEHDFKIKDKIRGRERKGSFF